MAFRIIGGQFKGRSLNAPSEKTTRPTKSIVRGAVFNICQSWIEGARCLDLFAGSGAIGLEALSRGAVGATFVEVNSSAARVLRENLKQLGLTERGIVLTMTVSAACRRLREQRQQFDFIYIDPPYEKGLALEALMAAEALVSVQGALFIEESTRAKEKWEEIPLQRLRWYKSRLFGESVIHEFIVDSMRNE